MFSKVMTSVFENVLEEIVKNPDQISVVLIEILISLFNNDFIESLELIEENSVSLIKSSNDLRHVFEVKDDIKSKTKPDRYYCVIDANYCSCDRFRTGVLNDSLLFCKHLIASKLSKAMNKYSTVETTDVEINRLWTKHIIN